MSARTCSEVCSRRRRTDGVGIHKSAVRRIWNAREDRHKRAQRNLLNVLQDAITDLAADYELRPVASVSGQPKQFNAFFEKAESFAADGRVKDAKDCFVQIGDIVRARVVCQTLADVDRMQRLLEDNKDGFFVENSTVFDLKDRTSTGYRAIHLNAYVDVVESGAPVAVQCEVQLQTALQYAWGLYTHKDFYKGDDIPELVRELMIQLSDLLSVADNVADELIREVERVRSENSTLVPAVEPDGADNPA